MSRNLNLTNSRENRSKWIHDDYLVDVVEQAARAVVIVAAAVVGMVAADVVTVNVAMAVDAVTVENAVAPFLSLTMPSDWNQSISIKWNV